MLDPASPDQLTALPIEPTSRPLRLGWGVPDALKRQWSADGYVVLEQAVPHHEIDAYNAIVAEVRRSVPNGLDSHGFGDRIGQLHQKHPELIELIDRPAILKFLAWAFGEEPVIFASLNFQRSTQQEAHIDAIFFWPDPCYAMAGVWVALEDVHPDAGPLFYLPASHRWPFIQSQHVVSTRPGLAARRDAAHQGMLDPAEFGQTIRDLGLAWTEDFKALERARGGKRVQMPVRKGDVIIWHSLLAHGGSPRANPALSRISAVFHFFGKTARLYSNEQFFLHSQAEMRGLTPQQPPVELYKGRLGYMRYPFFVTYDGGREVVHPLG